ncbi:S41 family peptidase [Rhodocytophaga aerolata]|uniref:S41 family peptidase n=1 Tax=Rhodocytophaga aerolata TaxID=455078 RepID=A0ABT8RGI1_9BACT|nr:S41 family peptidase [Rhodocytophaga aerolata]MDO1451200.1 S41 family peptidase [Rhodocytophaga aerolata]
MKTANAPYLHKFLWLLLIILPFSACNQFDFREEISPIKKPSGLEGIWQSEGYGYVMDVSNGKATVYDYTSTTCLKKTFFFDLPGFEVANWDVSLNAKGDELLYKAKGPITEFRFKRINKLPKVCDNGGIAPTRDAKVNFDLLWQTFEDQYAFFNLRQVDWKSLRDKYRPQVTEQNLETTFQQLISHFNEDHVTLSVNGDDFLNRFDAGAIRTFARFYAENPAGTSQQNIKLYAIGEYEKIVGNVITSYLHGNVQTALNNQIIWGKLEGNIGYLHVGQMSGYELSDLQLVLDQVFTELKNCPSMVVDVRFNLGGSDRLALEIAGRFTSVQQIGWKFTARTGNGFAREQVVMQKPTGGYTFTKPTVVLTSILTSSAAEVFTLMMRQLPQVQTMGESTNGIFSTVLPKELPNGWLLTLSNERLTDAQGQVFEGTGIPVDIAAPFPSKAERDNGQDSGIEKAISWLKNQ